MAPKSWLRMLKILCGSDPNRLAVSGRRSRAGFVKPQVRLLEVRLAPANVTTLVSFMGNVGGANPFAGLVRDNSGNLFGTTTQGGTSGYGTVFELAHNSGAITTLASFHYYDGANPYAGLVEDSNGNLFGTTYYGGVFGYGTLFELAHGSSNITTLASFHGYDGAYPYAGLTEDSNGNLYGTTNQGGTSGYGTVFELAHNSGTITTLASFHYYDGANPNAGLVEDSSGNLFGTSSFGGASGNGTVFELAHGSGAITTLASFNNNNGSYIYGGLTEDGSGNLFGTTYGGGAFGYGTVFELAHGSGAIITLASFINSNGANPTASLVEDSSGNLFGTTLFGGAYGYGTAFELEHGSRNITTLVSFNNNIGANPYAGLVEDSTGNLFGTTSNGGLSGYGTVFEVTLDTIAPTTLASLTKADLTPYTPGTWTNQAITVSLNASDNAGGSGVATTYYRIGSSGSYSVYDSGHKPVVSANGATLASFYSVDNAGNIETAQTVAIEVDQTPPVVTMTGPAANSITNHSTPTLTATASDSPSGVANVQFQISSDNGATWNTVGTAATAPYAAPVASALQDGNYLARAIATDVAGNSTTSSAVSFTVDTTAPLITGVSDIPDPFSPNGDGIKDTTTISYNVNEPSSVTLTVADNANQPVQTLLNAVSQGPGSFAATWDGRNGQGQIVPDGTYTYNIQATDAAGNTTNSASLVGTDHTVTVDDTAPTMAITALPTDPTRLNAVSFTFAGTDNVTASTDLVFQYSLDGNIFWTLPNNGNTLSLSGLADGRYGLLVRSVDQAGNVSGTAGYSWTVDTTAPTTAAVVTGTQGNAGWYTGPATITLSADDSNGTAAISGLDKTYYSVDGAAPQTYTGVVTLSADGTHTFSYWSIDNAGNAETPRHTLNINIDQTPPTISGAATTAPNAAGWYNGPVIIHFSAADPSPGSGLARVTDQGVLTQDLAQIAGLAIDVAGNASVIWVRLTNIDSTAPVTSVTASTAANANGWNNTDVTLTLSATDNLSGVKATYYTVDGGATQTGTSLSLSQGIHDVTYWSVDNADNVEVSQTITVRIDETAPTTGLAATGASLAGTFFTWASADQSSGPASTIVQVDGQVVSSASAGSLVTQPGAHTVSVTTTDLAGNTTTNTLHTPGVSVSDVGGTYDGGAFAATGTALGLDGHTAVAGSFSYAYYVGNSPTGTASASPPSGAGTYAVVATFTSGDPSYTNGVAETVFTIAPAPLRVSVDADPSTAAQDAYTRIYGTADPTFTVRYSGLVHGEAATVLGGALSFSTNESTSSHVGTYTVAASGLTSTNYDITYINDTLTITAAPLAISADNQSKAYGMPNPALTASYSGFVNGDTPADLDTPAVLSTAATVLSPIGSYAITASGAADPDYAITYTAGTLTVTPAVFPVTNTNDSGPGSLRQAILNADIDAAQPTITFAIPGNGPQTIHLLSPLPSVTNPTVIDGTTQPGYAGSPLVVLDGSAVPVGSNGLYHSSNSTTARGGIDITAGSTTVRGLDFGNFQLAAISMEVGGGNLIAGNYIGTDPTGTTVVSNGIGIEIYGSSNNIIRGNLVSGCNVGNGIDLTNNSSGNSVVGNFVGTDATGTHALGGSFSGISIHDAENNTIGGTTATDRNIISGNGGVGGVSLDEDDAGNVIIGNYIGTDVTGLHALGNVQSGIYIGPGTGDVTIGGTTPGAGNVISGNHTGIMINTGNTPGNVLVVGNYIGTDATGLHALGNDNGVDLLPGSHNIIGGTTPAARNIISGNVNVGVIIQRGSTDNVVLGNYIGTDVTGSAPLGNRNTGVFIGNGSSSNNTIGGTAPGAGNVIAYTGGGDSTHGEGILVNSGTGNAILSNSIFGNAGLAIDLIQANNANNSQAAPLLTQGAILSAGGTQVVGSLSSIPNTTFHLEFFYSPAAGNGQTLLATESVTTDASGMANFAFNFATTVPWHQFVTATATDPSGNTSAFSSAVTAKVRPSGTVAQDNLTYGTALAGTQLGGILGGVAGSFAFTGPDNGTVLHVTGSPYTEAYLFTPTDTADYATAAGTATVAVAPALLTIIASPETKVYGQNDPSLSYQVSGLQSSDTASGVLTGNLTRAAGEHVGSYSISQGTLSAGNDYTIAFTGSTLNVTPYSFTYQIGNDSQVYGSPAHFASDLGTTLATGVNGETLAIAYSSTGDTATAHVQVGGYTITGVLTNGTGLISDYDVTLKTGTLTVNPYAFTYHIANDSQVFGAPANLATDLGTTISTFVNGQNLAITYSSIGDTANAVVGAYPITGVLSNGTGQLSDYTPTLVNGTLAVHLPAQPAAYILSGAAAGALSASGNAVVNVPGGLFVDSNSATAIVASGKAQVNVGGTVDVVGGVSTSGGARCAVTGTPGSIVDPLTSLPWPSVDGLTNYGAVSISAGSQTLYPGIYTSIQVSGQANVTLSPGVYILAGGGLAVSGRGSLSGNGVLMFNAGSTYNGTTDGGTFGSLSIGGNGSISLSAPATGAYAGVAIFQSSANTRAMALGGNGTASINGTVYVPSANVGLSGNMQVVGSLVVSTLTVTGYAGAFQLQDGVNSSYDASACNWISNGLLTVAAQDDTGHGLDSNELARLGDAINYLNSALGSFGVHLSWAPAGTSADVTVHFASTTPEGGLADGVLGFTTASNDVYIVNGWNFYTGSDASQLGPDQFDFLTLATHELAHTVGLGESVDPSSVMYEYLDAGTVRRTFTDANLARINTNSDRFMKVSGAPGAPLRSMPAKVLTPLALPADLAWLAQPAHLTTDLAFASLGGGSHVDAWAQGGSDSAFLGDQVTSSSPSSGSEAPAAFWSDGAAAADALSALVDALASKRDWSLFGQDIL